MRSIDDLETWIIEFGDDVIHKEHEFGASSLSPAERAVYDLWAVDYAVRNAGDMEALEDVRPAAAIDLAEFLRSHGHPNLASYMSELSSARSDCDSYYERFAELCEAIQGTLPAA
jgi:hypothetical protein